MVVAVLLACLGPIASGDLWWHVRTGVWILENGQLPTTDPFSHTAGDKPWILQEYGSQVAFGWLHSLGGFGLLKVFSAALSLSILAVVWRRARRNLEVSYAAAFTCLFALLFAMKWELRPHLFSLLLFFWMESCLFPARSQADLDEPELASLDTPSPKRMVVLFAISAIWVQLHAEALFAPLLVLAVVVGAILASFRSPAPARHIGAWTAMFLAALVGTMASPLFLAPHHYALFGRGVPQQFIEEWFRPWVLPGDERFAPLSPGVFVAYALALFAGGLFTLKLLIDKVSGSKSGASVSWQRLAFLAGCLLFALSARRFFWLTWFPLLDAAVLYLSSKPKLRANALVPSALALVFALLLFPTHYVAIANRALQSGEYTSLVDPSFFPAGATDFAREAQLQGNLYNPYEWGGYLGWTLGSAAPVFIDARTVLFEDVIEERWHAERDPAIRADVFQSRNVELVVFKHFVNRGAGAQPWTPNSGPSSPNWIRVWSDRLATVWVLERSANAARAAQHWAELGVTMDPRDGITEAAVNAVNPELLATKRMLPPTLIAALRDREASATGPGQLSLARASFWLERRMKRNAREELRSIQSQLQGAQTKAASAATQYIEAHLGGSDLQPLIEWLEVRLPNLLP
ncbi:MAG: hypothetical protein ACI8Q9_002532 [Planctomycetota bacterium]|jgi:hypothetical protein